MTGHLPMVIGVSVGSSFALLVVAGIMCLFLKRRRFFWRRPARERAYMSNITSQQNQISVTPLKINTTGPMKPNEIQLPLQGTADSKMQNRRHLSSSSSVECKGAASAMTSVRRSIDSPDEPGIFSPDTPTADDYDSGTENMEADEPDEGPSQLHFKVEYSFEKSALIVTIFKAVGLKVKDRHSRSTDPYVKLIILPEKEFKVKTRVFRNTRNPVYDETFYFYGLNFNELKKLTLHFVVFHSDRYSRDAVIGEVAYPLKKVKLSEDPVDCVQEIVERNPQKLDCAGELLLSLCYHPPSNRLTVGVLKIKGLPKTNITELTDPYITVAFLYNDEVLSERKTSIKRRTLNPVYNETFVFDCPADGLQGVGVELQVMDFECETLNSTLGYLEIGTNIDGQTVNHWNAMCNAPKRQIAQWHKLIRPVQF